MNGIMCRAGLVYTDNEWNHFRLRCYGRTKVQSLAGTFSRRGIPFSEELTVYLLALISS